MKPPKKRGNSTFAIGWWAFEVGLTVLLTWLFVIILNHWWQPLAAWWQNSWWWYAIIVMGVYGVVAFISTKSPQ